MLCTRDLTRSDVERAKDLVEEGYVVEWIVDNLPGATSFVTTDKSKKYYAAGFKLGSVDFTSAGEQRTLLNNHHTIVIRYRRAPGRDGDNGGKVVVGFEVYPKSIGVDTPMNDAGCPFDMQHITHNLELKVPPKGEDYNDEDAARPITSVRYTYSVYFREDESIEWSRRWDLYFVNQEDGNRIHWLAIINSLTICGLLTGIVAIIFAKTIRADIKGYKDLKSEEAMIKLKRNKTASPSLASVEKPGGAGLLSATGEAGQIDGGADYDDNDDDDDGDEAFEDASGWKLLHSDVFRTPAYGYLLAALVGSGVQLLLMALGLVLLSAFGVLNPSFRGGFISVGMGLFVFNGLFSGYFSARVFKTLDGQSWRRNALVTALFVPGLLFGIVFLLNLFVWAEASSTAIPFSTLLALVVLWLCIQVPLVYAGSWYGFNNSAAWEHPTKATSIPRQVPPQTWYLRPIQMILFAGLIPFAIIFIELLFVFRSVWQDKSGYYYVFGFLAVVSLILLVAVAEVTIMTVFMQLCAENHDWWWRSFLVGGSSAVWVFAYCVWYYFFKLNITGFVSSMLFFGYSLMACCIYGLLTGTVGFLSAYAFIRRIYG